VEGNGPAIDATNTAGVRIEDNLFEGVGLAVFELGSTGFGFIDNRGEGAIIQLDPQDGVIADNTLGTLQVINLGLFSPGALIVDGNDARQIVFVRGNGVLSDNHAGDRGIIVSSVNFEATPSSLEVRDNTTTGGTLRVRVGPDVDASIGGNTVEDAARNGIELQAEPGSRIEVDDNMSLGSGKDGISIKAGAGADVTLSRNTSNGSERDGLAILALGAADNAGLVFVFDHVSRDNGRDGVHVGSDGRAMLSHGLLADNGASAAFAARGASLGTRFASYAGTSSVLLDLAPRGVSLNDDEKQANGDLDFPEPVAWDRSDFTLTGFSELAVAVEIYSLDLDFSNDRELLSHVSDANVTVSGSFSLVLDLGDECPRLVTKALDAQGWTSEFGMPIDTCPE
jgi:hypothetical protein